MRTRSRLPLRVLRRNPPLGNLTDAEVLDLSQFTNGVKVPAGANTQRMRDAVAAAAADLSASKFYNPQSGIQLYPYQAAALAYINEMSVRSGVPHGAGTAWRLGIFDPPGIGKTLTGVAVAVLFECKVTVIVRPASASAAWPKAFESLAKNQFHIVDIPANPTLATAKCQEAKLTSVTKPVVLTMNYTSVITAAASVRAVFPVIDLLIFDEAHNLRNPDTQRTIQARALMDDSLRTLLLTGTPALSSALEIFSILGFLEVANGGYSPHSTLDALEAYQDVFLQQSSDPGFLVRPGLKDVAYPSSTGALSPRVRRVGVRRSRKSLISEEAAEADQLQGFKQRSVIWVPVDKAYKDEADKAFAKIDQGTAPGTFRDILQNRVRFENELRRAISHLMNRPQGWPGQKRRDPKTGKVLKKAIDKVVDLEVTDRSVTISMPLMIRAFIEALRSAKMSIPDKLQDHMSRLSVAGAVKVPGLPQYANSKGVFMLRNIVPTVKLAHELSVAYPGVPVYMVIGGDPADVVQEEQVVRPLIRPYTSLSRVGYFLDGVPHEASTEFEDIEREFAKPGRKFLVATQIANAGLSLPSADFLVMAQRLFSPGEEEQAEDRINRAGKMSRAGARNDIIYVMPDDIFSAVLGHRLENRRRSLLALYGEKPGDDNATSLVAAFRKKAQMATPRQSTFFEVVDAASDPMLYVRRAVADVIP
jgi:hypothetical protein